MHPERIIIHHSAGQDHPAFDVAGIRDWHLNKGWRDIGYHLLIEKVKGRYEAILGRPFDERGAHCIGQNQRSLGVCFIGDYTEVAPTVEMLRCGANHIAGLMRVIGLGISAETVTPHRAHWATDCPGKSFPMEQLVETIYGM